MTTLYIKQGRRYVVWGDSTSWSHDADVMRAGQARLTVCTGVGAYRYTHGVTPDTAGWAATAALARASMVEAMSAAAVARPSADLTPYTTDQLDVIERFRAEMAAVGGLLPTLWRHASADEIASAGIAAVLAFAKGLKP